MQNVVPIDVGVTGDRQVPVRIVRVPITATTTPTPWSAVGNAVGSAVNSGVDAPRIPPTGTDGNTGSYRTTLPIARAVPEGGNGGPDTSSGNGNPSSGSDPVLQGILDALGGGGGGSTYPAGAGLAPSGLIGSAQTGSGGSPAVVILVLVAVAVGGYFLWEKYKGKLKKHEEA